MPGRRKKRLAENNNFPRCRLRRNTACRDSVIDQQCISAGTAFIALPICGQSDSPSVRIEFQRTVFGRQVLVEIRQCNLVIRKDRDDYLCLVLGRKNKRNRQIRIVKCSHPHTRTQLDTVNNVCILGNDKINNAVGCAQGNQVGTAFAGEGGHTKKDSGDRSHFRKSHKKLLFLLVYAGMKESLTLTEEMIAKQQECDRMESGIKTAGRKAAGMKRWADHMGIESRWRIQTGSMKKGPYNRISDVPGVTAGHCTIADGSIQTGVTAIRPHPGNLFRDKVMAACHVINGFGKTAGLVEIEEMGFLETPVMLTNTFGVGTVTNALVKYMLAENPEIGDTTGTVNPVVCECNDGILNDIRGMHIKEEHAFEALKNCSADFAEGAVGAGRGMKCHGLKGGIGTASRQFEIGAQTYTVGVLTLTNHALLTDLMLAGEPVSRFIKEKKAAEVPEEKDKGSVIAVLATDAPLSERQLKRISKRTAMGLARTGSYMMNGSGEIAIAFTTANRIPQFPEQEEILSFKMLPDDQLDILFRGVAEVVEEAVLSSMLHAEAVTGRNGKRLNSLKDLLAGSSLDTEA